MTMLWSLARLRVAAPMLASAVEPLMQGLPPTAPVSADTLELAASRLPVAARPLAAKLVAKLRAPADTRFEAALEGVRASLLARVPPVLAWENGVVGEATTIGQDEAIELPKALPDGRILSIGPGRAILWNADGTRGATCLLEADQHAIAYDGTVLANGRVVYPHDGQLHLFNPDGTQIAEIFAHPDRVMRVANFTDGRFVTSSTKGDVKVWSADGKCIATLPPQKDSVCALAVTADNRILCADIVGTDIHVYDAAGKHLADLSGHQQTVRYIAAWPDGGFVSASNDDTARVWSDDGKLLHVLDGHKYSLAQVLAMPGHQVLTVAENGQARIWDASGKEIARLENGPHPLKRAALMADGSIFTCDASRSTGVIWRPKA